MWKFQKMPRERIGADPVQGEFFCEDIPDKLVREAVQNSLDARSSKSQSPARILFSYHMGAHCFGELSRRGMPFEGLAEHLKAEGSGIHRAPEPEELVDFLLIEDFGTTGLNGDPEEWEERAPITPSDDGPSHDFYFFWRNVGRTGKTCQKPGSWGLGKQVFPGSSRINTFFGFTIRSEDNRALLMGQSVLKVHHTPSGKHEPYGFYADYQGDDFAIPFSCEEQTRRFLAVAPMQRDGEHGLSIAIPFPNLDLQDRGPIIRAILTEFFHPIIHGQLVVGVNYPGSDPVQIDPGTVKKFSHEFLPDDNALLQNIELTIQSKQVNEGNVVELDMPKEMRWKSVVLPKEKVDEMVRLLEVDRFIAINIPVMVVVKGTVTESAFRLYIARHDGKFRTSCRYIREGIDVKEASSAKLDAGISALLEIHDQTLGGLLNRAENPAHTKWMIRGGDNNRLADYTDWRMVITYVRDAPHEILKWILRTEMEARKDLLNDIFFVEEEKVEKPPVVKESDHSEDDAESGAEEVDPPPPNPAKLYFRELGGEGQEVPGFKIKKNGMFHEDLSSLVVKAAYRVSRGNSLKKYTPFDFRFDPKSPLIEYSGLELLTCDRNVIEAKVLSQDFELEVRGFDKRRDLYVYLNAITAKESDDQET